MNEICNLYMFKSIQLMKFHNLWTYKFTIICFRIKVEHRLFKLLLLLHLYLYFSIFNFDLWEWTKKYLGPSTIIEHQTGHIDTERINWLWKMLTLKSSITFLYKIIYMFIWCFIDNFFETILIEFPLISLIWVKFPKNIWTYLHQ